MYLIVTSHSNDNDSSLETNYQHVHVLYVYRSNYLTPPGFSTLSKEEAQQKSEPRQGPFQASEVLHPFQDRGFRDPEPERERRERL